MQRIYLSGPMTGLPDYNYPAFNAEAARLRALGYTVENPAENPPVPGHVWELYMRAAIHKLLVLRGSVPPFPIYPHACRCTAGGVLLCKIFHLALARTKP